jgi:nitric oxide dioxygenase
MLKDSERAANEFYATLFRLSPELRHLFPAQMTGQARKFAATLLVAINSLENWNALAPVVEALARRHLSYGVERDHYAMVGRALIATLQNFEATTEELEAWTLTYTALSSHMIATAYPETKPV